MTDRAKIAGLPTSQLYWGLYFGTCAASGIELPRPRASNGKKKDMFLWGGKTCCALIATPNADNANRRQKKGKKLNYELRVILMQKGIVVFVFANYLDNVLVWNYTMSGFKRRMEMAGMGFVSACIHVLNSLKFRLLSKRCPREWRVG